MSEAKSWICLLWENCNSEWDGAFLYANLPNFFLGFCHKLPRGEMELSSRSELNCEYYALLCMIGSSFSQSEQTLCLGGSYKTCIITPESTQPPDSQPSSSSSSSYLGLLLHWLPHPPQATLSNDTRLLPWQLHSLNNDSLGRGTCNNTARASHYIPLQEQVPSKQNSRSG